MITINYKGKFIRIKEAAQAANELLKNSAFYDKIKAHPAFDKANVSPKDIADLIQNANINMRVILYISLNPQVFGYDDKYNPDIIHINRLKMKRSKGSLVNTMIHETVHAVDAITNQYEFGHGDNSSVGKDNTAPYWIGNLAGEIAEGRAVKDLALEHDLDPEN